MRLSPQVHALFKGRRLFCSSQTKRGGIPVIGVDPGKNGAFAVIDPDGVATTVKMPLTVDGKDTDYAVLSAYFSDLRMSGVQHVYVEGLVKFAGRNQSGASAIVYGYNSGAIRGIVEANKFHIHYVYPVHWQRNFTNKSTTDFPSRTAWKTHLRNIAQQLFPYLKVTKADCDALLIAKYGWYFQNQKI